MDRGSQLARLTGDAAAHDRATSAIQRAAQLAPGESLLLVNASEALLESGLRGVIGDSIDLRVLRRDAGLEMLDFLVKDERGREAIAARLRANPLITRALAMKEKVTLLAPRNPDYYASIVRVLESRRDGDGLRKLLSSLEPHRAGSRRPRPSGAREDESGARDQQMREWARGALSLSEPILPVARAKGGATFAAAVRQAIETRMGASLHGMRTDLDATVAVAEEAAAASPSISSRYALISALIFRANGPAVACRCPRRRDAAGLLPGRSPAEELVAALVSVDGPIKQRVVQDPDLNRAIEMFHQMHAACPSFASGPRSWALLRATGFPMTPRRW